jgi:xanthine dehydrogenase accessory factor
MLDPMRFAAGIAMTHLAAADLDALNEMAHRPIDSVGLLGKESRRDGLLAQLDDGEPTALEGRLHAPVGLALGGVGPEPIALSIVADLQRHFSQRA